MSRIKFSEFDWVRKGSEGFLIQVARPGKMEAEAVEKP